MNKQETIEVLSTLEELGDSYKAKIELVSFYNEREIRFFKDKLEKVNRSIELLTNNMAVKPIFTIGLTSRTSLLEVRETQTLVESRMKDDYHVLTYIQPNSEEVKFEVFYEKDFNEVKYEELKEIVRKKLNNV